MAWRKGLVPSRSVEVMRALVDMEVYVEIGMIMLQPDSSLEDVRANVAFLRRLPYFNVYNLDQALWPFHLGRGRFNIDETRLDPSPARIFRTYAFRDDRVRQDATVCAEMGRGLGDLFYLVRKRTWENLARVPGILARFCGVQRSLLEPYLAAIEEAVVLIDSGARDEQLAEHAAGSVERLRPAFARLSEDFCTDVARSGGRIEGGGPAYAGHPSP